MQLIGSSGSISCLLLVPNPQLAEHCVNPDHSVHPPSTGHCTRPLPPGPPPLQGLVLLGRPAHWAPPTDGGGFVQVRVFVCNWIESDTRSSVQSLGIKSYCSYFNLLIFSEEFKLIVSG